MKVSVWGWSVSVCVWRNAGKEPYQKKINISEQTDNFNETLVGGFNPSEKHYIVKLDHFPR